MSDDLLSLYYRLFRVANNFFFLYFSLQTTKRRDGIVPFYLSPVLDKTTLRVSFVLFSCILFKSLRIINEKKKDKVTNFENFKERGW